MFLTQYNVYLLQQCVIWPEALGGAGAARCVQELGDVRCVVFFHSPGAGAACCVVELKHRRDVGLPHEPGAAAAWCVVKVKETTAYNLPS